MTIRNILYGYAIQNGCLITIASEEKIVQKMFGWYCQGLSYQSIANQLNREHTPYSPENPDWNKNKVKRMLENPRYTGQNNHPPIIPDVTFQQVQDLIQSKGGRKLTAPKPQKVMPKPMAYTYVPTGAALRNTNQVHHGLDHPDNPNEIIDCILQGISIRYQCLQRQE